MKKVTLLFTMMLFVVVANANNKTDLFTLDQDKFDVAMAELNDLEVFVEANGIANYAELTAKNAALTYNLSLNADLSGFERDSFGFDDMEWGSFLWGFCCWPIGLFTVLLNDSKGRNHKISYFIGIGTAFLLNGVGYGAGLYRF
jgi:hypothetical protein